MAWLVLTRAGVARFTSLGVTAEATVFVHPVRSAAEVADALVTIRDHHPGEAVSVETTAA